MSRHNWVNDRYITERIILQVEAHVSYRIKKHRNELISVLKRELKKVILCNGNINIKKAKVKGQ